MSVQPSTITLEGNIMATLSPNQIKVGDKLIIRNDHIGRPDSTVEVTLKEIRGKTWFGLKGYWRDGDYATSLCAQGYRIVERNGREVGTFFTRYW